MKMRIVPVFGICGLLVLGLLACGKMQKDNSKVIASVGGEKVTEKYFNDTVRVYFGDAEQTEVDALLTKPEMREQRNQLLARLVQQKALLQFAKSKGLDKDPQVKIHVTGAIADAYLQVLVERLVPKAEPTDSQLRDFYNEYVAKAKAENRASDTPPFGQIKAQLPIVWKYRQIQLAKDTLMTQIKQQYPLVFDSEYKTDQMQP
jgi:hypothetical protein